VELFGDVFGVGELYSCMFLGVFMSELFLVLAFAFLCYAVFHPDDHISIIGFEITLFGSRF
jgi:hypothetical protein